MMTGGNIAEFQKLLETKITYMLTEWIESMKLLKKQKEDKAPTDLWGILTSFLTKPQYDNIYDKLLFIEFIKGDLAGLDDEWLAKSDK